MRSCRNPPKARNYRGEGSLSSDRQRGLRSTTEAACDLFVGVIWQMDQFVLSEDQWRHMRHSFRNALQQAVSLANLVRRASPEKLAAANVNLQAIAAVLAEQADAMTLEWDELQEQIMQQRRLRILLVEDDPVVAAEFVHTLTEAGHQLVSVAPSGEQMILMYRRHKPDMIIFDIHLPGTMTGLEAFAVLSREAPGAIAGVAVTGDESLNFVQQAQQDQILGYLLKPVKDSQLLAAVRFAWQQYEQFQFLRQQNETLCQTLAERKLIERAKSLLMSHYDLTDERAYKILRTGSMQHNLRVGAVAQMVLDGDLSMIQEGLTPANIRKALPPPTRSESQVIQQAKSLLADQYGMANDRAYKTMKSAAARHDRNIGEIAQMVLDGDLSLLQTLDASRLQKKGHEATDNAVAVGPKSGE